MCFFNLLRVLYVFFFFCKQKTVYEMRISDWSSDVCSSDLLTKKRKAQAHTTSLGAQPRIAGYETTRVNREASKQSALSLAGPWTGRSRCQLLMDGHPSLLRCAAYDGKPVG